MIKKIVANTSYQIAGKIVKILVGLVLTGMLTRALGVTGYGYLVLISALTVMLDSVADFGTKIIGVREMAREKGRGNRACTWASLVKFRLILAIVAMGIGLVIVISLPAFEGIRTEAMVAMLMVILTSFLGNLEIVFQSRLRMDLKLLIDVVYPLLTIGLVRLFLADISVLRVLLIYIVARGISMSLGWKVSTPPLRGFNVFKWTSGGKVKELFAKSWPMGLYLLLFSAYDRLIDSVILERYLGVAVVAYYGLAYKIYLNLVQGAYFLMNSAFPLMSRRDGENKKVMKNSMWLLIAGLLVILPTVYVLAPWMVSVLAPESFSQAVTVLRILLLALVFSYFSHLVGFGLISRGGEKKMLLVAVITLTFNLIGNLILIPRLGIIGAAWVTVATEAVGLTVMFLKR